MIMLSEESLALRRVGYNRVLDSRS
jgi:hypothetical protein